MDLGRFLFLFFSFSSSAISAESNSISVWFDGNGKKAYAPDSYVVPAASLQAAVLGKNLFIDQSFSLKPGNIQSWKWDYSSFQYVLELKEGLRFQNGREVTANDLEFSLTRGFFSGHSSFFFINFSEVVGVDPGKKMGFQYHSGMLAGFKVLDTHHLAIKLKNQNPSFLNSLAYSYFSIVPIEELQSDYFTWKKWPLGAGPYKIVNSSLIDSTIILQKNSINKEPIPNEIKIITGGDPSASDIVVGSVFDGPISKYARVINYSYNYLTLICFNYKTELGRSEIFRRAVAESIDRQQMTKNIDLLEPAYELLPKRFWGRLNAKATESNGKRAQSLLRSLPLNLQNKIKSSFVIPVRGTRGPGEIVKSLENQLKSIGLHVSFQNDDKKLWDASKESAPFIIVSLAIDSYDPLSELSVFKKESFLFPYVPFDDMQFNFVFSTAENSLKTDDRVDKVKAISNHVKEHALFIPLVNRYSATWYNKDRIETIGEQDGGMTFYFDRIRLKTNQK